LQAGLAVFAENGRAIAEVILPLVEVPTPLAELLRTCDQALIHGELRLDNLWLPDDGVVLLDWGERSGMASPAVELMWFPGSDALLWDCSREEVVDDSRDLYRDRVDDRTMDPAFIGGLVHLAGHFGLGLLGHSPTLGRLGGDETGNVPPPGPSWTGGSRRSTPPSRGRPSADEPMGGDPHTESGRSLRRTRHALLAGSFAAVLGRLAMHRGDPMFPLYLAITLGAMVVAAVLVVVLQRRSDRRTHAHGALVPFAANATAELAQLRALPARGDELGRTGWSPGTGGLVSGGLRITRQGIFFEPLELSAYWTLMLPWSLVATATVTDDPGPGHSALLEIRCHDGHEVAFLTVGRDALRTALQAAGKASR